MHSPLKIKLTDLNPHLTCIICNGYFINATTITECLHSFCRSCIVKYLETNKYCPICEVQIHKTKPLLNLRSDQTLQDIVYKLVPGLFQNEMQGRKKFYASHPNVEKPTDPELSGELSEGSYIYTSEDYISLSLEYYNNNNNNETRRYLRCPAAVSILHLQKLIRAKYGLTKNHKVDILYQNDSLNEDFTLIDVAYIHLWKRKVPLHLTYRIFEPDIPENEKFIEPVQLKRETSQIQEEEEEEKEVQLQISETGIISVRTSISNSPPSAILPTTLTTEQSKYPVIPINNTSSSNPILRLKPDLKLIRKTNIKTESPLQTKKRKLSEETKSTLDQIPVNTNPTAHSSTVTQSSIVSIAIPSPIPQQSKTTISKIPTLTVSSPLKLPTTVTSIAKLVASPLVKKTSGLPIKTNLTTKKSQPVGYKTLRDPPKTWNPTLPRTILSPFSSSSSCYTPTSSQTTSESCQKAIPVTTITPIVKAPKPNKFFKVRNNMPRYLGNPASGVKPMYQIANTVNHQQSPHPIISSSSNSQHKKTTVNNIEPKNSLKLPLVSASSSSSSSSSNRNSPMTVSEMLQLRNSPKVIGVTGADEKKPEQLKITQTTVPIYSPRVKLSKNDKKLRIEENVPLSPKLSPKQPSTVAASTSNKNSDKFNFMPPNPFIPNLSSPNLTNPNQFLFPNYAAMSNAYDPRILSAAAYHNLPLGLSAMLYNQHHHRYAAAAAAAAYSPPLSCTTSQSTTVSTSIVQSTIPVPTASATISTAATSISVPTTSPPSTKVKSSKDTIINNNNEKI